MIAESCVRHVRPIEILLVACPSVLIVERDYHIRTQDNSERHWSGVLKARQLKKANVNESNYDIICLGKKNDQIHKSQIADNTMTLKRLSEHGVISHLNKQTENEGPGKQQEK